MRNASVQDNVDESKPKRLFEKVFVQWRGAAEEEKEKEGENGDSEVI